MFALLSRDRTGQWAAAGGTPRGYSAGLAEASQIGCSRRRRKATWRACALSILRAAQAMWKNTPCVTTSQASRASCLASAIVTPSSSAGSINTRPSKPKRKLRSRHLPRNQVPTPRPVPSAPPMHTIANVTGKPRKPVAPSCSKILNNSANRPSPRQNSYSPNLVTNTIRIWPGTPARASAGRGSHNQSGSCSSWYSACRCREWSRSLRRYPKKLPTPFACRSCLARPRTNFGCATAT